MAGLSIDYSGGPWAITERAEVALDARIAHMGGETRVGLRGEYGGRRLLESSAARGRRCAALPRLWLVQEVAFWRPIARGSHPHLRRRIPVVQQEKAEHQRKSSSDGMLEGPKSGGKPDRTGAQK
ncbi:hypothetical protein C8J57DRAFT_1255277 [Mycena rebaudengoi]|nr:hypothetical protein C8J57DRAFT_1255277 [Mycena rebaudengoi]